MKEVFDLYKAGVVTKGIDWVDDLENAWVLAEDLRTERATAQLDFDGELHYKKVHPVVELTPEQEHLLRPSDTREGRRIAEIQQELKGL